MRLGVVLSLFLVLIVAAVLIGGRSIIGPMLQRAMAEARPREAAHPTSGFAWGSH